MENEQKLVVVLGPTASGKSALAVRLAKKFNGEVVSADSRQVYRGLDIGTGKISKKEMLGIPHHMLDIADPKRKFTAAHFQKRARRAIKEIYDRKKLPILCGGTGLYIHAVVDGVVFPEVKPNAKLRKELEGKPASKLAALLRKLDKKRHDAIDKNNPRRLMRAIEIATALGKVPSPVFVQVPFSFMLIGLNPSEKELRTLIGKRLAERLERGMVAEAKRLRKKGLSFKRMKELGLEYKFLAMHLEGKINRKELYELLEKEIWKYAKRQMTWFKRDGRIRWFEPRQVKAIETEVADFLA